MGGIMRDVARDRQAVLTAEVASWFAIVVVLSFVVPVLPIALALVLAFTRLRHMSPAVRAGIVALAVAILALQLVGLQGGTQVPGETSKPVKITVNG